MVTEYVKVTGLPTLLRHLDKLSHPAQSLDLAIQKTAAVMKGSLVRATLTRSARSSTFSYGKFDNVTAMNLATGHLSRAWTDPFKISKGYSISNSIKAGRFALADIMNRGRNELIAAPGHAFYLPLNRRGQDKHPGAKPTGLVFGKDYILTKKIKAFPGYHYLKPIIEEGGRLLTRNIILEIRKELST